MKELLCIKCGHKVKKEIDPELSKEYPYYCPHCDENLYDMETVEDN